MISDRPTIHPTEENQRLALVIVGAWSSKAPTWLPSRSRTSADSCPGDTGHRPFTHPPCSALNDPVAIVHIPLELAPAYATKLYWTIDSASLDSAEFFNVTSNRLEVGARVVFITL
jgi:hypothetical protein